MTRQKHLVTFLSPGTFVHETSSRSIDAWDPATAARVAQDIVERHGARPFAFFFETFTVADDIDDGAGGLLHVQPRKERESGRYYLGGTVLTMDDVERRGADGRILLANMRCNRWPRVIESKRSYRIVQPFEANDCIVNDDGRVVARGDAQSLAPTPGTEGGDGSPVVNQDKPGPGAIDVQHGASVDPSARAALSAALVSIQALIDELQQEEPIQLDAHREAAQIAHDTIIDHLMRDTPASTWLPGESDGTR